jgi:predicted tellurium resistance membrane protein TerC
MNFLMEMPERDAKYRYRSILAMYLLSPIAFGLFIWAAVYLPWWQALPVGVVSFGVGFFALIRIVNWILPKKLPKEQDWW